MSRDDVAKILKEIEEATERAECQEGAEPRYAFHLVGRILVRMAKDNPDVMPMNQVLPQGTVPDQRSVDALNRRIGCSADEAREIYLSVKKADNKRRDRK
jgi:hypothetical protein